MMRDLLFLSQRIPYPPNKGDKTRAYHFLRHLCARYRVHLGCFVDDPSDWIHVPTVSRMVTSLCALPISPRWRAVGSLRGFLNGSPLSLPYFYDRRMAKWVQEIRSDIPLSVAFIFSSPMAQYLLSDSRHIRIVADFVDVDSQKWAQYAASRRTGPMKWLYSRESRRLLSFERTVAERVDASLFVSEQERALFCTLSPTDPSTVHTVENGIDADYFSPAIHFQNPYVGGGPRLVFTGVMSYWPNIEAVRWFSMEILPKLRRSVPDVEFFIVGANPAPEVRAMGALPGVTVTGAVSDVRPYLAYASVVVAPLLTARGIQNKILEGMSMAQTVVATRQAYEGIRATSGVELIVSADDAGSFADAVLQVLRDPEAARVGCAARRRILTAYDWPSRFERLEQFLSIVPSASPV